MTNDIHRRTSLSIALRRETWAALEYLCSRWYPGQTDKRNASIQRAILETAEREGWSKD